ncbi:MAG: flagellar biosynthesis protein FlhA [Candidimonas sp.]|nr:MAG: flagellar biosynthesis protein FlhA [Candidimonas sp.]
MTSPSSPPSVRALFAAQPRALVGPVLILMVLAMMVLPLPPIVLDLLFTFNIAMAIMILLVAMFTKRPLDFAAFPSVLLFATLLRLSLNVASTRVVLLRGHTGPGAAGRVIEAFGHFLVGGDFAVGIVVFLILVLINFVVITKGAGRIAEVGARFTLDAMPGKQMAIDADLNAGLVTEDQARKRRAEVAQEAEFYGAMDGASKFVRGDAVAGLIIMGVCIVGGLLVGVLQHGMDLAQAASDYTLLTIGDGLVGQIPSLIVSTAAGVIVSRVATDQDVGQQIVGQLFVNPAPQYITAAIMLLMGLIPNMPHFAFLTLAAMLAIGATVIQRRARHVEASSAAAGEKLETAGAPEASWSDVKLVEPLSLEIGFRLIGLVDAGKGAELVGRVRALRRSFAQSVGFLPPVVHIRDNLELDPNTYRILISGVEVGRGEAWPGEWMAINPGDAGAPLAGRVSTEPTFGLPATWIPAAGREAAQVAGYTVVDAGTVLATQLDHLMHQYAATLFGRPQLQKLLARVEEESKGLTEDLTPKSVSQSVLLSVLRGLLVEGVPIRDMRSIAETLLDWGPRLQAPAAAAGASFPGDELLARVRVALGRAITQQCFGEAAECRALGLNTELGKVLATAVTSNGALEPTLAQRVLEHIKEALTHHTQRGDPAVLVTSPVLRATLARLLRVTVPDLAVLATSEIPAERIIHVTTVVGPN